MAKNKIKPRILPGFMELLPKEQILFNSMYDTIREVYESFGFLPLDTPVIELSEVLLAKAGGETEKQIYRFSKGDNDLSLRFDLTVPLARYVAQHSADLTFPFKRYQMSKVYRGERPQKGRFREFYQCDIDVIGNEELDLIYDAEMPAVIYNVFKRLDFGRFVIKINNRRILNGFFENLNLSDKIGDILRNIDKIEKIGKDAVIQELKEIGVEDNKTNEIIEFINIDGSSDEKLKSLKNMSVSNEKFTDGVNELESVIGYLRQFGVEEDCFEIDLKIARGLDYYTGTVYETVLRDYPGLGSVCSGGRYDNLTEYYTNRKLPGIGISIGLTRLFSQLISENIISAQSSSVVKVLVLPMDVDMGYTLKIADMLRKNNIPTDVYYSKKAMKQKMKYVDKLGVPFAVVIGEDEVNNNEATLKNMTSGAQITVKLDDLISEYKKQIGE